MNCQIYKVINLNQTLGILYRECVMWILLNQSLYTGPTECGLVCKLVFYIYVEPIHKDEELMLAKRVEAIFYTCGMLNKVKACAAWEAT
jgi:hypothetical protein